MRQNFIMISDEKGEIIAVVIATSYKKSSSIRYQIKCRFALWFEILPKKSFTINASAQ